MIGIFSQKPLKGLGEAVVSSLTTISRNLVWEFTRVHIANSMALLHGNDVNDSVLINTPRIRVSRLFHSAR